MRNKLLVLESLIWFTTYLSISTISLYFGKYVPSGNATLAGVALGIFFLIRGVTDIFAPKLIVKINKKKLLHQICLSTILMIVAHSLFLIQTIPSALLALILLGSSLGLYTPAKFALYASEDKSLNEKKWGLLDSVGLFTIAISSGISGGLVSIWGFQAVFLSALIFSIITFLFTLWINRSI